MRNIAIKLVSFLLTLAIALWLYKSIHWSKPMSGRSAKEALEAIKKKAESAYKSAKEKVTGAKETVETGDTDRVADQMGGQLGKTRDAIRKRNKALDEI